MTYITNPNDESEKDLHDSFKRKTYDVDEDLITGLILTEDGTPIFEI